MHERKRTIRSGASSVRIRKVLSIERLESRAVLAGLVGVGDSLLDPPSMGQESPPAEVATVEVPASESPTAVEPTPPLIGPTVPDPVRPEGIDPTSRPQDEWTEDASDQDSVIGAITDSECDPDLAELQAGCLVNKSELQNSPGNDRTFSAEASAIQLDNSITPSRDQEGSLISLVGTSLSDSELSSSKLAAAATPRSAEHTMSFRYFAASLESGLAHSLTLKTESLAPYASGDTFVMFELLDFDGRHERSGDSAESHELRHVANHTRQSSAESSGNANLAWIESQAAIEEAEAALALAQKIVNEADAACVLGASEVDAAIFAEASAVSNVSIAAPAVSRDATKPGRQIAFSLQGGIQLGLLSMASIVISVRASEAGKASASESQAAQSKRTHRT